MNGSKVATAARLLCLAAACAGSSWGGEFGEGQSAREFLILAGESAAPAVPEVAPAGSVPGQAWKGALEWAMRLHKLLGEAVEATSDRADTKEVAAAQGRLQEFIDDSPSELGHLDRIARGAILDLAIVNAQKHSGTRIPEKDVLDRLRANADMPPEALLDPKSEPVISLQEWAGRLHGLLREAVKAISNHAGAGDIFAVQGRLQDFIDDSPSKADALDRIARGAILDLALVSADRYQELPQTKDIIERLRAAVDRSPEALLAPKSEASLQECVGRLHNLLRADAQYPWNPGTFLRALDMAQANGLDEKRLFDELVRVVEAKRPAVSRVAASRNVYMWILDHRSELSGKCATDWERKYLDNLYSVAKGVFWDRQ